MAARLSAALAAFAGSCGVPVVAQDASDASDSITNASNATTNSSEDAFNAAPNVSEVCVAPLLCGLAPRAAPRLVATVAGVLGAPGGIGDGGAATRARLLRPTGVAVNPALRMLYVADTGNHAVRAVDLELDTIATIAGILGAPGGDAAAAAPASPPLLRAPRTIAAAPGWQRLYVADTEDHVVREVDLVTGEAVVVAGVLHHAGRSSGDVATASELNFPRGLAVDEADSLLYIADTNNHVVRVLNLTDGTMSTLAGVLGSGGLAGDGGDADRSLLHFPYGLELDRAAGRLFVAEPYNHAVRAVDLATGELSTVAGVLGVPGTEGDGGPATRARLHFPYDVSLDSASRQLFVADANNHAIRLVDLVTGRMTTAAGRLGSPGRAGAAGPAWDAQFDYPTGVAVDPRGRRLYVADRRNSAARAVDLGVRVLTTLAGELAQHGYQDGAGAAARFDSPRGVVVSPGTQEVFVADASGHAVRRLHVESNNVSTVIGGSAGDGGIAMNLTFPCGLALGSANATSPKLYVADAGAHVVYAVDLRAGSAVVVAGTLAAFGEPPASGDLRRPYGLALDDGDDVLYIADQGNHVVRALDLGTGNLSVIAGVFGEPGSGGDGGAVTAARLWSPSGLALSTAGGAKRLFIADTENHAVRVVDLSAQRITTVAGVLGTPGRAVDGNAAIEAELYFPYSVAVDSVAQQLFIADNWNHAIRMVDLSSGLMTTLAGVLGTYGTAGDGGRADLAQMHFPQGLALDMEARRLYVADSGNHALRLVALSDEVRSQLTDFGMV